MSKWQQYIVLGGILFIFQTKGVRQIFQSSSFLYTVCGTIAVILVVAVIASVCTEKRKEKQKEEDDMSL